MPLNTIWREEGFSYATSQATCRRRRRQIEFEQFARMVATPNINARHQRALDASQSLTIYGASRATAGALLASVTACPGTAKCDVADNFTSVSTRTRSGGSRSLHEQENANAKKRNGRDFQNR